MRSNERLRTAWRRASGSALRDAEIDGLALRISLEGARALRARQSRWNRRATAIGVVAVAAALVAIVAMPAQTRPTLLGAVSGGEPSARTFEAALVGPRDGAWVIAAAIGNDQ
jgi:hypothetical protein